MFGFFPNFFRKKSQATKQAPLTPPNTDSAVIYIEGTKLSSAEFKKVVDYWLYILPNGIDRTIFENNLKTLFKNNKKNSLKIILFSKSSGVTNSYSTSSQSNSDTDSVLIENLVFGNQKFPFKSAIQYYGISLNHICNAHNNPLWPLRGCEPGQTIMVFNNLLEETNPPSIQVKFYNEFNYEVSIHNLEDTVNDPLQSRGLGRKINDTVSKKPPTTLLGNVQIRIKNAQVTDGWPQYEIPYYNNDFINPPEEFTPKLYKEIKDLACKLEREYLSIWYMNKDRKLIKIKALAELVSQIYNMPGKPLDMIVNEIKIAYPEAWLGDWSTRVASIFERLVPSSQADSKPSRR